MLWTHQRNNLLFDKNFLPPNKNPLIPSNLLNHQIFALFSSRQNFFPRYVRRYKVLSRLSIFENFHVSHVDGKEQLHTIKW